MQLENTFTVPVDIDTVYDALNDPEKVTPCFPGAALTSQDGDDFTGTVKVKLGPISMTYKGKGTFVERDKSAHKVVVDAQGRDSRGNGTASAKATLTMSEAGSGQTKVTVLTEMQVTGKPAQFGRGVMADVGDKILGQFASCLADEFAEAPAPAASSGNGVVEHLQRRRARGELGGRPGLGRGDPRLAARRAVARRLRVGCARGRADGLDGRRGPHGQRHRGQARRVARLGRRSPAGVAGAALGEPRASQAPAGRGHRPARRLGWCRHEARRPGRGRRRRARADPPDHPARASLILRRPTAATPTLLPSDGRTAPLTRPGAERPECRP